MQEEVVLPYATDARIRVEAGNDGIRKRHRPLLWSIRPSLN